MRVRCLSLALAVVWLASVPALAGLAVSPAMSGGSRPLAATDDVRPRIRPASSMATPSPMLFQQFEGVYPASDPDNTGNWGLVPDLSDEFEGDTLDSDKWLRDGEDGWFMYSWPGRAPSQFAPENIRVEDGKLKLTTRWDPDYDFVDQLDPDCNCPYETYTTAAVISNSTFLYGYMEVRVKAADASITSSFWATGQNSELDVFEFVGDSAWRDRDSTYPFCVHDWSQGGAGWCDEVELDWRVADDFHVYGCEWDESGLKFYADGLLVRDAPAAEIGSLWCLDEQMCIWFDSETFAWEGLPEESDLPVDYEIEYVRTWQHRTFGDVPSDHWAYSEVMACSSAGIVSGYGDGLYHPEREVTRDQMAVFVARGLAGGEEGVPDFAGTPTFPDVDAEHWALDYVEYVVSQNIVEGYEDGTYRPTNEVTRGQMSVYVARAMVAPTTAVLADYVPAEPRNFPDVDSEHWAYSYVEYCVEHGIVGGFLDGTYRPETVVTRDQMAVYIARVFGLLG
jgi:hypothetical protein